LGLVSLYHRPPSGKWCPSSKLITSINHECLFIVNENKWLCEWFSFKLKLFEYTIASNKSGCPSCLKIKSSSNAINV
jgi:hypothetical protein